LTYTGRQFRPLAPRVEDIVIEDIAHALSNICRFTGHVRHFYSVAQHSIYVARSLPRSLQLWGLLHDAGEAYLCDVATPVKNQLIGYRAAEEDLMKAVALKFGLDWPQHPEVKAADRLMFYRERDQLMPAHPDLDPTPFAAQDFSIPHWTPEKAKIVFLSEFLQLQ
jgi:hypothetical protein